MNDFSRSLVGCSGIFKERQFYKKDASMKERTFVFDSGAGLDPKGTNRLVAGHFLDGFKGVANTYDFEAIITPDGKIIKAPTTEFIDMVDVAAVAVEPVPEAPKTVRRKR